MSITTNEFGITKSNEKCNIYTLKNSLGTTVQVINYGATVVSIKTADKDGNFSDIVLGYDNITSYENGDKYFGAIVGRCANRIAGGKFKINDNTYEVAVNNGPNHLHGGIKGFNSKIWAANIIDDKNNIIEFSYLSKDGEENYPGNLNVKIRYELNDNNEFKIGYKAVSDKDTVVNLTNHSYFNLSGHDSGTILDHELMINADTFTVNDETSIPTGEIRSVKNSPMDFTSLKRVGDEIDSSYEQIQFGAGYDHNWVLNANGDLNVLSAKVVDNKSGRILEMYTTTPGVQFYSANFLDGSDIGKDNTPYIRRSGMCLETQYAPNAINESKFKTTLLKANDTYDNTTIFKFSTL